MRKKYAEIPALPWHTPASQHRDRVRPGPGPGCKPSWEGAGSLIQRMLWEHGGPGMEAESWQQGRGTEGRDELMPGETCRCRFRALWLKVPGQPRGEAKLVTQGSGEHQQVPGQAQGAQEPPEQGQVNRPVLVSSRGRRGLTRGQG